jgi:osmoprotectant transport system permease protein
MENVKEQLLVLPGNLAHHLNITVLPLLIGVLIVLPLAVTLTRRPKWRYPTLTAVGVIQTIPGLALLALMVPLLAALSYLTSVALGVRFSALGFWPTVLALTLYSMLPMLRNAVTGILGVPDAMSEAARAMGMTDRQRLFKVELPLAAPVILAGIRTATVWTVGIATLATPVGQRCLGNYIFRGLQTRNWIAVMFGCVSAALLAILLDLLLAGLEKAVRMRRRRLGIVCGALLAVAVVGGTTAPRLVRWIRTLSDPTRPRVARFGGRHRNGKLSRIVRVGAKGFTEQYILAALMRRRLQRAGFEVMVKESLGSTVIFDALKKGDIDCYVDYSGTIWANYMKQTHSAPPWKVLAMVGGWLAETHSIRMLGPLGFENAYAMAMRRKQATHLEITSLSDLARHASSLTIGADFEFFGRPEWRALRDTYGLRFGDRTTFDPTFMYEAVSRGKVDVITAFTSDGRIQTFDLVLLDDPAHAIPPYHAVILLSEKAAGRKGVVAALRPLINRIPVSLMRRANHHVERSENKQTPKQAARWLDAQLSKNAQLIPKTPNP